MLNVFSHIPPTLSLFFDEASVQILCPFFFFFYQLLVFLPSFMSAGYIQDASLSVKYMHSDYIFLACGLPF